METEDLGSCLAQVPYFCTALLLGLLPYTFSTGMTHTKGTHKNTQTRVSINFHLVYRIVLGRSFVDKNPFTILFFWERKKAVHLKT